MLHNTFENDPEPMNLGLATAGLVLGISLVMYVDIKGRAIQREKAQSAGRTVGAAPVANGGDEARWTGGLFLPASSPAKRGAISDDPERQALLPPRPLRHTLSSDLSTVQERVEP